MLTVRIMDTDMHTTMTTSATALLHLLRLTSPALPVGAFAYSQGLEGAVSAGVVRDENRARDWILGLLEHSVAQLDVPVLARLHTAWSEDDWPGVERWSERLHASRETRELQEEDSALGRALARLLISLGEPRAARLGSHPSVTWAASFALAAVHAGITLTDTAHGYLFAGLENQVNAAVRLIPLGQTAGQRILVSGIERIPGAVARGIALLDDEIGAAAPGLALLSAGHETQYARLFRS